ncbi:acetate kinase [Liquorilactobacillus satsumensis]|uniref:acetate/propionate family kinase n=1 Tax=Liquorilactobacillus satsumensis TaxID=259059 RepID=UPI0021C26BD0|nr:acetate kinase [Liquorilactobacillus satsumensis]MCP9312450.1 acetate kinase [Liquorilactobacillus satsumensis]MCP9329037.1 acetate kinase [Liquorilactobacillus satsumensis]MCP9359739.1 acetate kinase [Liquorilactobacillus satsumensis]
MRKILAVNSGSSTLKMRVFEMPCEKESASLLFDPIKREHCNILLKTGTQQKIWHLQQGFDYNEAVAYAVKLLLNSKVISSLDEIKGVGHRIVAGGERFTHSVVITPEVLTQIEKLSELAPLHNPANLKGIAAIQKILPEVPQVAVFDTAFHAAMPAKNFLYALPYAYYTKYGVRKYGAHGTSHRYVALQAAQKLHKPLSKLKLITLHLGSGASITAIKDGKSVDTSMGFSPVSGLMMSSRAGDVDFSALAYLMHKGVIANIDSCLALLNHDSGLLGISQHSADLRQIEEKAKTDPQSQLAIEMFVKKICDYLGAYWLELGGADALVFTGGIGERDAKMRARITAKLGALQIFADLAANKDANEREADFTGKDSKARLFVIPTNEELMIARDVNELTNEVSLKVGEHLKKN